MILVLLGTQDKPFNRLISAVSKLKREGIIKDKIVAQVGCTIFEDENIDSFDYAPKEEITKLIEEARLVITHAGVGTITDCISKDKKVIVVPRLKKYGEHTNDHQLQITKEFAEKDYIYPLYNLRNLKKAMNDVKNFKPSKYKPNKENFVAMIKEYIDTL